MDIIEKVKTAVLDWTIKLESEGILGENTTFSEQEKQVAATIPQTINNYYGNTNIVSSPTENMQIVSGNNNEVSFSYEFAKKAVEEIEYSISTKDISDIDKEYALNIINNIKNQIDNKNKPSSILQVLCKYKIVQKNLFKWTELNSVRFYVIRKISTCQ